MRTNKILSQETLIVSQKSNERKTVSQLLNKFLERGEIIVREFKSVTVRKNDGYGDQDILLSFTIESCPQMSISPAISLAGDIPVHIDYAGKISLGWFTGADISESNNDYETISYIESVRREFGKNLYLQLFASEDHHDFDEIFSLSLDNESQEWHNYFEEEFEEKITSILKEVICREFAKSL